MEKTSIPCPNPGCGALMEVKKDRYGRPGAFCKECRTQVLVRGQKGAELWEGGKKPAEIPAPPAPKAAPAPPPAAPPKGKGIFDGFLD